MSFYGLWLELSEQDKVKELKRLNTDSFWRKNGAIPFIYGPQAKPELFYSTDDSITHHTLRNRHALRLSSGVLAGEVEEMGNPRRIS